MCVCVCVRPSLRMGGLCDPPPSCGQRGLDWQERRPAPCPSRSLCKCPALGGGWRQADSAPGSPSLPLAAEVWEGVLRLPPAAVEEEGFPRLLPGSIPGPNFSRQPWHFAYTEEHGLFPRVLRRLSFLPQGTPGDREAPLAPPSSSSLTSPRRAPAEGPR